MVSQQINVVFWEKHKAKAGIPCPEVAIIISVGLYFLYAREPCMQNVKLRWQIKSGGEEIK